MPDLTTMTPAVNPDRDGDALLEERLANVVRTYDAQGDHRTGSATDGAAADWLSRAVEVFGLQANLESFALERRDPADCHLRLGNRRIDGMPLLDGGPTPSAGVPGYLGTEDSPGAIVLTVVRTGLPGHGEHRAVEKGVPCPPDDAGRGQPPR